MLARTDLFAECLTQAIGARFQDQEVVRLSDADSLLDGNLVGVTLVMLYRVPMANFPSIIRMIHEFHPESGRRSAGRKRGRDRRIGFASGSEEG